jgi:hypothetical protein
VCVWAIAVQQVGRCDYQAWFVLLSPAFCWPQFGGYELFAKAHPAIAAHVHTGFGESFEEIENDMIVTAEAENVTCQEKRWASSSCLDWPGIASFREFVEELACEFDKSTAK